uniref:Uncharacterized protein n=1 Tax=Anguilla anguilla TaxID=7936 RepID=A0A0E9QYE8_ANGAN
MYFNENNCTLEFPPLLCIVFACRLQFEFQSSVMFWGCVIFFFP